MATDAPPPYPRTDTPNDFVDDTGNDTDTQVVLLVTPVPAPEPELPTYDDTIDEDAGLASPPPPPRIELRHLRVPKTTLYELFPEGLWTDSAITAALGYPLKIARYLGSEENKTPNPSMIGFSMLCDFDNPHDFGKVVWTKVLGAVVVAKIDGSEMDVQDFTAVVKYVNLLGEELRAMKLQVDEDMKGWDAEVAAKRKVAREEGREDEMMVGRKERLEVKETKRLEVVTRWARERVNVEAFERFKRVLEMGVEGDEEMEGVDDDELVDERVDEVIEGMQDTSIGA